MDIAQTRGMAFWACGVILTSVTWLHAQAPTEPPATAAPTPLEPLLPPKAPADDAPKPPADPTPAKTPATPADETEDPLGSATSSAQAQIIARIRKTLTTPATALDPAFAKNRLDQLADDADLLERTSDSGAQRYHALSLLVQSLYNRLQRWPDDTDNDRRLSRMRAAARRLKSIDQPDAATVGDFWLVTASLFEINHSDLRPNERRYQARQLLKEHLDRHPAGPTAAAAKAALVALQPTTRPAPGTPPALESQPAPTPAPAPGTTPSLTPILPPAPATPAAQATPPIPTDPAAAAAQRSRRALDDITQPAFAIDQKATDADGVIRCTIRSRYQPGASILRVLVPANPASPTTRILFVLPVESGEGREFGDGFEEIRTLALHEKHNMIVVAPTIAQTPWYADNAKDPAIRQDSYIIKAVIPAISQLYPIDKPQRMLLGFSKSGWGAVSLMIRNSELFDAAAAWDAPLMQSTIHEFGIEPIFGSQENFDHYALPGQVRTYTTTLRKQKRLVLMGYDHFRDHMRRFHDLLVEQEIPHDFIDGPEARHAWNTGWIPAAVEKLAEIAK